MCYPKRNEQPCPAVMGLAIRVHNLCLFNGTVGGITFVYFMADTNQGCRIQPYFGPQQYYIPVGCYLCFHDKILPGHIYHTFITAFFTVPGICITDIQYPGIDQTQCIIHKYAPAGNK